MKRLGRLTLAVLILVAIAYAAFQIIEREPEQQGQGSSAQVKVPAKPPASAKQRLAIAQAMFTERCKKSGFFIHKTVTDVEGIFLMKIRPKETNSGNQFRLDDPYGNDTGTEGYIKNFLRGRDEVGSLNTKRPVTNGYYYVEAIDPADGRRYRYTGGMKDVEKISSIIGGGDGRTKFMVREYTLDKVPAPGQRPRYGVTYDDISTREEREYWIAGSSLKVIDLETDEVIAERIGYMMDYGQGSRAGHRSPWLLAAKNACPSFPTTSAKRPVQIHQTRRFVEKVLHIKQGKTDG